VFPPDELRAIADAAGAAGALMLVDEAYHPFYAETALPWIGEYPHLVVTRSTGKAWAMAGLRIGYAAAAADVAAVLHKVRPMYETSTLAVAVFERMLDHTDEMVASVRRLDEGKQAFLGTMRGLGLRTLDGYGNFLHVAFGAKARAVHAALDGIVYYRRDSADPCLKGFSRFSATTRERFQPVIERIREAV
jgi:histidinol-phosphate aminotransferase